MYIAHKSFLDDALYKFTYLLTYLFTFKKALLESILRTTKCANMTMLQSMWAQRERSEKRSGAGRKLGGAERSVELSWQKTMEREQSGERAKSAAHSPLHPNISLT